MVEQQVYVAAILRVVGMKIVLWMHVCVCNRVLYLQTCSVCKVAGM